MKFPPAPLRTICRLVSLLASASLVSSMLASCNRTSPIAREKHWFDSAFDVTRNAVLRGMADPDHAGMGDLGDTEIMEAIDREARDQEERVRLLMAAEAGSQTVLSAFDEIGIDQHDSLEKSGDKRLLEVDANLADFLQTLKDNKRKIREKGWKRYLNDRESLRVPPPPLRL